MVGLYDGSEGEFQFLFTSRDTGFGGRVWPSAILAVAFPLIEGIFCGVFLVRLFRE